jgi:hypothetical protein
MAVAARIEQFQNVNSGDALIGQSTEKIVVYTAIFGRKDLLIEPRVAPPGMDFVCFTDQDFNSRTWKIRKIPPPVSGDMTRSARRVKILAHEYLPEYSISMWVDGNIALLKDPRELIEKYLTKADIAVVDHSKSKEMPMHTLAEHVERLLWMERIGKHQDDADVIRKQFEHYQGVGYPDDQGLSWTLVLLRRHNLSHISHAMDMWWSELSQWSKRDQMSFNWVMWSSGVRFSYMDLDGSDNKYFKRLNHYLSPQKRILSYALGAMKRFRRFVG